VDTIFIRGVVSDTVLCIYVSDPELCLVGPSEVKVNSVQILRTRDRGLSNVETFSYASGSC